ncbi:glutamine--fructose-6-phosphate transaminase (isomerizing) [Candidatus Gottesmanbacteria bacterium]|nr:glutamine--fructose-6-phosphate transaminase (isomerizing) [Candidatus Gottesmanbacteria bacterium]
MCGIFGYIGDKKTAPSMVLTGLKTLEYRGYDSWGVAVVPDSADEKKVIFVKKKAGKIGAATVSDLPPGSLAFGHTRWATHGGVTDKNAHPHLDCTKMIAVIHNGIVENHETLRNELKKKGHVFVSETDTEVIAHLVEEYLKKFSVLPRDAAPAFSKAVQATFKDLDGLNAIIVINTMADEMVAARNGSPLVVGFGTGENFLASDPVALLPYTKQVHFLEDDEMVVVTRQNIHIFNAHSGERIRPKKQLLTWTAEETEKGKFPYFMLKEIHEQPGMLSEIAADSTQQASALARELQKASRIYLVGSGTSGYAARAGSYYFATVGQKITNWSSPTEMHHHIDILPKNAVMLVMSQSGETMDLLDVVKRAKEHGTRVLSLVNVVNSSLWRMSDLSLPIGAGPEKGVASTKAFTATVAQLILMAYAMNNDTKTGQKLVAQAAKATRAVLTEKNVKLIKDVAGSLKNAEHLFVVGRGISYVTVMECALKIKEISYIHAEGVSAGELKHGPLALITKSATCIVYAPNDQHHASAIANAMEMKARGAHIIGVAPTKEDVFDEYIPVPDIGEASIIPNVVVGQLLAYYLTLERGFDPDMPRNLAKSVTVK